eukprot:29902-Pelagococcus_subviridis.AAC.3
MADVKANDVAGALMQNSCVPRPRPILARPRALTRASRDRFSLSTPFFGTSTRVRPPLARARALASRPPRTDAARSIPSPRRFRYCDTKIKGIASGKGNVETGSVSPPHLSAYVGADVPVRFGFRPKRTRRPSVVARSSVRRASRLVVARRRSSSLTLNPTWF